MGQSQDNAYIMTDFSGPEGSSCLGKHYFNNCPNFHRWCMWSRQRSLSDLPSMLMRSSALNNSTTLLMCQGLKSGVWKSMPARCDEAQRFLSQHPMQPYRFNASRMRAAASRCPNPSPAANRLSVRAANTCYKTHKVLRMK